MAKGLASPPVKYNNAASCMTSNPSSSAPSRFPSLVRAGLARERKMFEIASKPKTTRLSASGNLYPSPKWTTSIATLCPTTAIQRTKISVCNLRRLPSGASRSTGRTLAMSGKLSESVFCFLNMFTRATRVTKFTQAP